MNVMHLSDLPERTQDYLKVLWDLSEHSGGAPIALKELAGRLNQKVPTASEAVKRLVAQGLVEHERYAGVSLTPEGQALSMGMVRRHRLLETFLVKELGYTWDDVPLHTPVTIERVCDGDTELLRYLDSHGVGLGVEVVVDSRVAGLLNLHAGDEEFSLAEVAAADVTVRANEV